ncbi:MAG: hypothetical protein QOG62_1795, partial [Thermoleophilaceae bacterium]|nr:hypothetical protein [Thermoleophilaceae bacterium]
GDPLADTDAWLAEAEQYAAIGIERIHWVPLTPDPAATVAELGEKVWPRLAEIEVGSRA